MARWDDEDYWDDADEGRAAFERYHYNTKLAQPADQNQLYDLENAPEAAGRSSPRERMSEIFQTRMAKSRRHCSVAVI